MLAESRRERWHAHGTHVSSVSNVGRRGMRISSGRRSSPGTWALASSRTWRLGTMTLRPRMDRPSSGYKPPIRPDQRHGTTETFVPEEKHDHRWRSFMPSGMSARWRPSAFLSGTASGSDGALRCPCPALWAGERAHMRAITRHYWLCPGTDRTTISRPWGPA
jgi:hypothetical protein